MEMAALIHVMLKQAGVAQELSLSAHPAVGMGQRMEVRHAMMAI